MTSQRLAYINTGFTDYDVGFNNSGNWGDYTRTFPSGVYNIVMRGANGSAAPGSVTIGIVSGDTTTTNQTNTVLGTFTVPVTGGWQAYTWIPLRDNNGNLVKFTGGSKSTLRVTSGSGYNANFFALFQANTNLPALAKVTPAGTNLFESTNTLSFTATSSAGISANSISGPAQWRWMSLPTSSWAVLPRVAPSPIRICSLTPVIPSSYNVRRMVTGT